MKNNYCVGLLKLAFVCLLLLTFSACSDSEDSTTEELVPSYKVTAYEAGKTFVTARFDKYVDGMPMMRNIRLSGEDRVEASVLTEVKELEKKSQNGDAYYSASFDYDYFEGSEYTIAFKRGSSDTSRLSADNSFVSLPTPFSLHEPQENSEYSHYGSILLTWDVSANETGLLNVSFEIECGIVDSETYQAISLREFSIPDSYGYAWLYVNDIALASLPNDNACELDIIVTRSRLGTLDSNFLTGTITAEQVRRVTVRIIP